MLEVLPKYFLFDIHSLALVGPNWMRAYAWRASRSNLCQAFTEEGSLPYIYGRRGTHRCLAD